MIRFCENPECGRGFVDLGLVERDQQPKLCPTCRHHLGEEPLSRLVGGEPREKVASKGKRKMSAKRGGE